MKFKNLDLLLSDALIQCEISKEAFENVLENYLTPNEENELEMQLLESELD